MRKSPQSYRLILSDIIWRKIYRIPNMGVDFLELEFWALVLTHIWNSIYFSPNYVRKYKSIRLR